ncbi:restriction endonuclease subunit S [uncultured Veillonella sp.]|uniref:restriction endonuclease subunit S n=1 Tax=uncultured Veillonella sp. TaxID=159268 RepID=UPI00259A1FCC|nr:restriction endonuclease subunit S [uncultured Veillonella sp.]
MKYKLGDICEEIREKILTSDLSEQEYISTDNMIVNRGGVIDAVSLPSYELQEKRVILPCLFDELINYNDQINKNLYKQIRTLSQAWFSNYSIFGGKCPKSWSNFYLSDIADFINGYSYKGVELQSSNIAMATIKNFNRNGGFKYESFKEVIPSNKVKAEHYINLYDVLVAHTDLTQKADVIGNAEIVLDYYKYDKIIYSMDLVKVVPKISNLSPFLLSAILSIPQFKAHCLGYISGTTVLHLSKKALPEFQLMLPADLSELKKLDDIITPMYIQISVITKEIFQLRLLRDSLLPKLLSGEIDISKIKL